MYYVVRISWVLKVRSDEMSSAETFLSMQLFDLLFKFSNNNT
jgi:hypothetical protein